MDICDFGGGDDGGYVEVAFGALRGAYADGVIGEADVEGVSVGLGVNDNSLDGEFLAGPNDP